MELTVKITPQVARRLRLAASGRSRSTPAMAGDALHEIPPPEGRPDIPAGPAGQMVRARGGAAVSLVPTKGPAMAASAS